jgi:hypothetical protein
MKIFFIIMGIAIGAAIAFLLNKLLAVKVENKNYRMALQAAAYIMCVLLSSLFMFFGSLRIILDKFVDEKIVYLEKTLNRLIPEENILEKNIDTSEVYSMLLEAQAIVDGEKAEGIIEKLVIRSLTSTLSKYIRLAKDNVAGVAEFNNSDGVVTVKSMLEYVKAKVLNAVSPYFIFGQIAVIVLLAIFIGIYYGIVIYLKKGGAKNNNSIILGDTQFNR